MTRPIVINFADEEARARVHSRDVLRRAAGTKDFAPFLIRPPDKAVGDDPSSFLRSDPRQTL